MGGRKDKREYRFKELYGLLFLAIGVFFGLCLISYNPIDPALNSASNIPEISNFGGAVGAYLADILFTIFGVSAYVLSALFLFLSVMQFMGRVIRIRWPELIAYSVLLVAASGILHLRFEFVEVAGQPISGGGLAGSLLGDILRKYLNKSGAYIAASALFAITFFYATHISVKSALKAARVTTVFAARSLVRLAILAWRGIVSGIRHARPAAMNAAKHLANLAAKTIEKVRKKDEVRIGNTQPARPKTTEATLASQRPVIPAEKKEAQVPISAPAPVPAQVQTPAPPAADPKIFARADTQKKTYNAQLELAHISKDYSFPPLSLLDSGQQEKAEVDTGALKKNAIMLSHKLKDYDVEGKVTEIHPGPVITMFEFEPAAGVKINKIVNLADDLAVAMGGRSIRIVPHLPGKAAIGIEIPNNIREIVNLKDIIADEKFAKSYSKLTIALGKNTQGSPVISDLGKMPHLLIAGATGSGKSVAINALICSMLYKSTPEQVRMILVDPKTLELPVYNGIPHLLLPVVTQPRHAGMALAWALREMEKRYVLLSDVGARNIGVYNTKIQKGMMKVLTPDEASKIQEENPEQVVHTGKLPYIVIIIDELADLIMVAAKEIEENVTRLAQMARAAGIHLIVATQRPSVDVITGLIKANFPTRIAFKVSSKHDSRTIIDGVGAEHLLGAGDMLFMPPNTSSLIRIHGAYVSDAEIERVVKHLKEQGSPCYDESILKPQTAASGDFDGEADELYDMAVKIVAETRQASISMIQRRLRIGYNRAARLVEKMEAEGVVSPADGSKPREVYVGNAK